MTYQDLMKEHIKEQCKYCRLNECEGIRVTIDNKTKCNKTEEEYERVFNNK